MRKYGPSRFRAMVRPSILWGNILTLASSRNHPPTDKFTPKLVSSLREGYDAERFRRDLVAGLTVAIVALPLSMAIAIASHAKPEAGLFTAIVGGVLISALGGSRFQIGGPAGAFIVLLASIIDAHGFGGLLLATLMAGVILLALGLSGLGTYIRYVPHPVTVGFTAGIAVIIAASQIRDFLGLRLPGPEPGPLIPKLASLWTALSSISLATFGVSLMSVGIIVVLRKFRPHWPGFLIAVVSAALFTTVFHLNTETIHARFGDLPSTLPVPRLPDISAALIAELLPAALALALLGGIESLLSAVVADAMSGRRHRPNMELVAQGIANIGCSLFGGITATGTIARTATNVRAGAATPLAGVFHALIIALFLLIAAPLAGFIPLASLAAILIVVSWNMAEKAEFIRLASNSRGDAAVLLATFLLVIFYDLPTGITVGVVMGSLLFMHRMSETIAIETHHSEVAETGSENPSAAGVMIHRISGAFFFGAVSTVMTTLERIADVPRAHIFDFSSVPFVDSSAARAFNEFVRKTAKQGVPVYLANASFHVRRELVASGIKKPEVRYGKTVDDCLASIANGHQPLPDEPG